MSQSQSQRRMAERTSSRASTLSADRRERISVTVRPTDEKSRSDWAELAETHNSLLALAVSDSIGNCSTFCCQNTTGSTAGAGAVMFFHTSKLKIDASHKLGAVTVKRRRLISDLVSLDTASIVITANQQQSMGIKLVHLKLERQ